MKAVVLKEFIDKVTRKFHDIGSEYTANDDRVKMLAERGIVEIIKEEVKKKK